MRSRDNIAVEGVFVRNVDVVLVGEESTVSPPVGEARMKGRGNGAIEGLESIHQQTSLFDLRAIQMSQLVTESSSFPQPLQVSPAPPDTQPHNDTATHRLPQLSPATPALPSYSSSLQLL
jgi:hypothetical protein